MLLVAPVESSDAQPSHRGAQALGWGRPIFNTLGTPADKRRRVVLDTGHDLSPNEAFGGETIDRFDRYLGSPR
ncbi:MAG: hypothetical protein KA371_10550 [Acidobacteria bacterium]|nr:hypothetical protein [Acidobacteriota bacterium]